MDRLEIVIIAKSSLDKISTFPVGDDYGLCVAKKMSKQEVLGRLYEAVRRQFDQNSSIQLATEDKILSALHGLQVIEFELYTAVLLVWRLSGCHDKLA